MAYRGRQVRLVDRGRSLRVPAVVASLLLVEQLLMDEVGTPAVLLRMLGDLGAARTSPVVTMLALMALLVEVIIGYTLAVLVLRSLCMLPGPMGRVAGRLASAVTPVAVRHLLDLLVGARCSPRRPWRRRARRRIAGAPLGWPWPRPRRSAARSTRPAPWTWPRSIREQRDAGLWRMCRNRPERGPPPAGQRRRCRPGWGAGRPTRPPTTPSSGATRCGTSPRPTCRRRTGQLGTSSGTGSRSTRRTGRSSVPIRT